MTSYRDIRADPTDSGGATFVHWRHVPVGQLLRDGLGLKLTYRFIESANGGARYIPDWLIMP